MNSSLPGDDELNAGFDAVGHGVAIWSAEGRLLHCNGAYSRSFGRADPASLQGKHLDEFLYEISQSSNLIIMQSREQWLKDELRAFHQHLPSLFLFSDGSTFELERWPTRSGGSVSLLRDITEVLRNERTLQKERDKSVESEGVKSRFLRAANHDLRQPLAALKILIYNCIEAQTTEEREQLFLAGE